MRHYTIRIYSEICKKNKIFVEFRKHLIDILSNTGYIYI
jgi:hypothetical protein